MSGRQLKRARMFRGTSSSGSRRATRQRHTRPGFGAAGPRALGIAAVGGRRRQNVRTAGFLGIEHKFYDTFQTAFTIVASNDASGGEVDPDSGVNISAPPQGDNASSRDGKRILVESVQINGQIVIPQRNGQATSDEMPSFFIALVQDTQTNAATLNSEDVFKNPSGNTTLGVNVVKNLLSGNRFITHKVWKMQAPMASLAAATVTDDLSVMGQLIEFELFKKLQMGVDFNGGTTADIANVVNNSLHMIAYTNDNGWAASIRYNARIRFVG